jgi:hypothetical protein
MELLGDVRLVEPHLVSVKERTAVCAQCTTSSEIILDAHDGTAR